MILLIRPGRWERTTTRSDMKHASEMEWVTMRIVFSSLPRSRAKASASIFESDHQGLRRVHPSTEEGVKGKSPHNGHSLLHSTGEFFGIVRPEFSVQLHHLEKSFDAVDLLLLGKSALGDPEGKKAILKTRYHGTTSILGRRFRNLVLSLMLQVFSRRWRSFLR